MGDRALVYKTKLLDNLKESEKHLLRLNGAFNELEKQYHFPIDIDNFKDIVNNTQYLAYSDQSIYRFSKLQDCMGAKLFKSVLLYQGENVNKPFLDILNQPSFTLFQIKAYRGILLALEIKERKKSSEKV